MKLFYYYLRDKNRHPFGCVCIGIDNELKYTRGISLCSTKDQFVKRIARKNSKNRCVHALVTKKDYYPINYTLTEKHTVLSIIKLAVCKHLIPDLFKFNFKAEYNVNLTPFEYEIIKDEIV